MGILPLGTFLRWQSSLAVLLLFLGIFTDFSQAILSGREILIERQIALKVFFSNHLQRLVGRGSGEFVRSQ